MKRRSLLSAALVPVLATPQVLRAAERTIALPIASNAFAASGLRVMKQLGLFQRHGLFATISVMDSGNAALAAVLSGSAEGAEAAAGEMIAARARGQAVVAVADLYTGYSGSVALATPVTQRLAVGADAPVPQRLKALDGLIIASPSATSIYTLGFRQAAEAAGARIRFTYIAQPAMGAALESGAIQGMACAAPFWTGSVARGKAVMWINGPGREVPPEYTPLSSAMLLMRDATVRADRDLVQRLRAVVSDLGDMIKDDQDRVWAAAAALYSDMEPKALQLMLEAELGNLRTTPPTADLMRHEIAYLRASGTTLPNLDRLDPVAMLPAD